MMRKRMSHSSSPPPPSRFHSQTHVTEGFHRARQVGAAGSAVGSLPPRPVTMDERRLDSAVSVDETGQQSHTPRGSLMAPHELGVAMTPSQTDEEATASSKSKHSTVTSAHPAILKAHKRALRAINRYNEYERQQQEREVKRLQESDEADDLSQSRRQIAPPQSLGVSFTYKGMSVIIGITDFPSAYVICARTRFVLQQLNVTRDLPLSPGKASAAAASSHAEETKVSFGLSPIVSLKAHPITGQVVMIHSNGFVRSFLPLPVNPTESCYGRYEWLPHYEYQRRLNESQKQKPIAESIAASSVVLEAEELFSRNTLTTSSDEPLLSKWILSISMDYKILLAYGDQLAVLDTSFLCAAGAAESPRFHSADSCDSPNENYMNNVVWMSRMPGRIKAAQLSGDAHSIAVVCSDEGDGNHGVHILERDLEDGSEREWPAARRGQNAPKGPDLNLESKEKDRVEVMPDADEIDLPLSNSAARDSTETVSSGMPHFSRSRSVGAVYKPGPFLVHQRAVTRLVFRGHGLNTSSAYGSLRQRKRQQGNDLLLTYCEDALSARIFSQNGWRCLMEWDTPTRTRVDWVHGVSAFTLGDLEPKAMSTRSRNGSKASSRRPSLNNERHINHDNEASDTRRLHYQSIPSHTTPYSNAGAWISEISFQNAAPAVRLSRLTYLKRGVDELGPTLFENIVASLPVGMIPQEILCGDDDSFLSIEGVWPAWSPSFLDAAFTGADSNFSNVDALRGSAMSFLGLASGPVASPSASGSFSDGLLRSTQCPPCEVRLVAAHPFSGKLISLEFPVVGDHDWTSLELGNPTRSVLLFHELDRLSGKKHADAMVPMAYTTLDAGQLLAIKSKQGQDMISVSIRRSSTPMLLPLNWLSEDIDTDHVGAVFTERKWFKDESAFQIPVELPELYLPPEVCEGQSILELRWWADDSVGGPPMLVVLLSKGTIIVFEILPPWNADQCVVLGKNSRFPESPIMRSETFSSRVGELYEVSIVPDPEFGLGLRLEVLHDGNPAVAGSFKRNPISGENLPAEQTGLISLGDELVSANGVNLEEKMFDDIVATVRDIGAVSGVGNPMKLIFRRMSDLPPTPSTIPNGTESLVRSASLVSVVDEEVVRSANAFPNHYNVIAIFEDAMQGIAVCDGKVHPSICWKIITSTGDVASAFHVAEKACFLFCGFGNQVKVMCIQLSVLNGREASRLSDVGSWQNGMDEFFEVSAMDVVLIDHHQALILLCCIRGSVSLLACSLDLTPTSTTFQPFDLFHLKEESFRSMTLRLCDAGLWAMMAKQDRIGTEIRVWTAQPDPYTYDPDCHARVTAGPYHCYSILPESSSMANAFVDLEFLHTGYLEPTPSLLVFSMSYATIYKSEGFNLEWLPAIRIWYQPIPEALSKFPTESISQGDVSLNCYSPRLTCSHLKALIRTVSLSSNAEINLRADWHPECLIASLFLDASGPFAALDKFVRPLFYWLQSEGLGLPKDQVGRLCCAPAYIYQRAEEQKSADINESMRDLSISLAACCLVEDGVLSSSKREQVAELSFSQTKCPPILQALDPEDIYLIRSICELLVDKRDGVLYDTAGQHFIFIAKMMTSMFTVRSTSREMETHEPGFSMKQAISTSNSQRIDTGERRTTIPSSACLSALLSDTQAELIDFTKTIDGKFNWSVAKSLKMPFWVRSDIMLARIAEEIGQNLFRSDRDILESALFFIISRKTMTLRNLAATDSSENGRKFYKFLCSHDFSSEKGRGAAEKNGFSLLRKCKYRAASAFFLLAEPPLLSSAVETLATKLMDFDLAFLVARLMESKEFPSQATRSSGLSMGGGAGYSIPSNSNNMTQRGIAYKEWSPELSATSRKLLIERSASVIRDDRHFGAVQLLWLRRKEDAAWVCSGVTLPSEYKSTAPILSPTNEGPGLPAQTVDHAYRRLCMYIDSLSPPLILKAMDANERIRMAATLVLSQVLEQRGVELVSLRFLLDTMASKNAIVKQRAHVATGTDVPSVGGHGIYEGGKLAQSSIFDEFEVPVAPSARMMKPQEHTSSIFDSFEVPHESLKRQKESRLHREDLTNAHAQSPIFERFDMPSITAPASQALAVGESKSSLPPVAQDHQSWSLDLDLVGTSNASLCSTGEVIIEEPLAESMPSTMDGSVITPTLWLVWNQQIIIRTAARRLVREVATALAPFHADPPEATIEHFFQSTTSLIPSNSPSTLQVACDAEVLLNSSRQSLDALCCEATQLRHAIVSAALLLLGNSDLQPRVFIASVLLTAVGREDLAENMVRAAASEQMSFCRLIACSTDKLSTSRSNKAYMASLFLKRYAARLSWQLEACLWFHRGAGLPLSGIALQEAIVAVRAGLLVASWNHNHECLEAMIRNDPDCCTDMESGQQLWASLKASALPSGVPSEKKLSSGGWEFLVDCKRSEATLMLSDKKTGCFILRPHPGDNGVFTLSFKTNLVSADLESKNALGEQAADISGDDLTDNEIAATNKRSGKCKKSRNNQSVQHAIVRLSEAGYRCGSFGPHTTLISLLEAVSASLPFALRFDLPPTNRVIQEEGSQPSPNAVFLRKLALSHADSLITAAQDPLQPDIQPSEMSKIPVGSALPSSIVIKDSFGACMELLIVSAARKQFSSIAAAEYKDILYSELETEGIHLDKEDAGKWQVHEWRSFSPVAPQGDRLAVAQRILNPILSWCRLLEVRTSCLISPPFQPSKLSDSFANSASSGMDDQMAGDHSKRPADGGDTILRKMIQRESSVHFSTLKLIHGGDSTLVVIFSRDEAVKWLLMSGFDASIELAETRLDMMEKNRLIESIDLSSLRIKQRVNSSIQEGVRYRILDPWEVEALHNWEGETLGASLGRDRFSAFNLGRVGVASENIFRSLGGVKMLELWTCTKGGLILTKGIAAMHPEWESCGGGDIQFKNGRIAEPSPFENSIRKHLFRNSCFQRLDLPQRFLGIIQVELLDLKNLSAAGGLLSMSVYALLRLRRVGANAELTNKSRTLDTAVTNPVRLGKATGPNAPASWGSVVRFRFPLPCESWTDGSAIDNDREILFKGPPRILQLAIYEKKILVDHSLGTADIRTDGLSPGGQLEEWVPLRNEKNGITWFARVRLTLRFELMCIATQEELLDLETVAPSVGLRKIRELSRLGGGSHEDMRKSVSSPDLVTYFESMVH